MRGVARWTPHEDNVLRRPGITAKQAWASINARRQYLGIAKKRGGGRVWSDEEDDCVRRFWPDRQAIVNRIPERSEGSIIARAGTRGLRQKRRGWTKRSLSDLAKDAAFMTDIELAAKYRTTPRIAQLKRLAAGVQKPLRPALNANVPPLAEDVRRHCVSAGPSLLSVGLMVGSPKLLTPAQIRKAGPSPAGFAQAVALLGGELYAEWQD